MRPPWRRPTAGAPPVVALLWAAAWCACRARGEGSYGAEASSRFLIATFSNPPKVHYMHLSDPIWRPLVADGLKMPGAVCVDPVNMRLFVSDLEAANVYWYQMSFLPEQKLIVQSPRLAAGNVSALGLDIDGVGSLYIAGKLLQPSDGSTMLRGILKQDAIKLATATATQALEPIPVWTQANTDAVGDGQSPQLFEPSGVGVDKFSIFWGNYLRGPETGAVVRSGMSVPITSPEEEVQPLANNVPSTSVVTSLAVTPASVFYSVEGGNLTGGAIYGVSKGKSDVDCGSDGQLCPQVATLDAPTSMAWDGDATIYVASGGSTHGAIHSFASGAVGPHVLVKVTDAKGVSGLAVLNAPDSSGSAARGRWAPAAPLLAAAAVAAAAVG